MNSRSEMRRLAVQNPDALVAEIERLRAENERLRDGLHTCHAGCPKASCVNRRLRDALGYVEKYQYCEVQWDTVLRKARAALAGGGAP